LIELTGITFTMSLRTFLKWKFMDFEWRDTIKISSFDFQRWTKSYGFGATWGQTNDRFFVWTISVLKTCTCSYYNINELKGYLKYFKCTKLQHLYKCVIQVSIEMALKYILVSFSFSTFTVGYTLLLN